MSSALCTLLYNLFYNRNIWSIIFVSHVTKFSSLGQLEFPKAHVNYILTANCNRMNNNNI